MLYKSLVVLLLQFLRIFGSHGHNRLLPAFVSALIASSPIKSIWIRTKSHEDCRGGIVLATFSDDLIFGMERRTFRVWCGQRRQLVCRQNTVMCAAIPLEKRIAVAVWYLASGSDFRTLPELFGIGKATVCVCVWDVCRAIRQTRKLFFFWMIWAQRRTCVSCIIWSKPASSPQYGCAHLLFVFLRVWKDVFFTKASVSVAVCLFRFLFFSKRENVFFGVWSNVFG